MDEQGPHHIRYTQLKNGLRVVEGRHHHLVYIRNDGRLALAWEVTVTGEGVDLPIHKRTYVSAQDASVLDEASEIHTALNRAVYSANNGTSTNAFWTSPARSMRA